MLGKSLTAGDLKAFGKSAPMIRVPESGHRLLDIADWDGSEFPIPKNVCDEFGVKAIDFSFKPEAEEDCASSSGRFSEVMFEHGKTENISQVFRLFQKVSKMLAENCTIDNNKIISLQFDGSCAVRVQLGSSLVSKIPHVQDGVMQFLWLIVPGVAVKLTNSVLNPGFENSLVCVFHCAGKQRVNGCLNFDEVQICKLTSESFVWSRTAFSPSNCRVWFG